MTTGAASRRVRVMGVLNVTPDSFSDGGRFVDADRAIERARALVARGADIVDVGGESTRPGAEPVTAEEEGRRVIPVVRTLASAGVHVSIDTLHAETAIAAVEAGARTVNDVSGATFDQDMLHAVAAARTPDGAAASIVLGHWRGVPDPAHQRSEYADVVTEVVDWLRDRAEAAVRAGIASDRIVLDPGLGFDKTGAQCWELLRRLPELSALGFPVLVGASRKRMIAETLSGVPEAARAHPGLEHERDLATAVVSALAAGAGAWGVRVHDVAATVQALAVEAAWSGGQDGARQTAAQQAVAQQADRITLTGLEVFAHHGVFDFEREQGQRFIVDAEVRIDLRRAADGDALGETVHYGELAEAIDAAVRRDPVDLIETVAERAASVALGFVGVQAVRVTVHKPDAPIGLPFADVSVTVERSARGAAR